MIVRQRHGFSLASLLMVVTVAAVLLAAGRNLKLHFEELDTWLVWLLGIVGGLVGFFAGVWFGCVQPRRLRALVLSVPTGILAGGGSAIVLAVPENLLVAVVGSLLLTVYGLVVRRYSEPPPSAASTEEVD